MQVLLKKKTDRNSVNEIIMLVLSSILLASNINQPSLVDIRICRLGGKIFHILMNNGKVKHRGRWRRFYCLNCGFSFTCDHSARYVFTETLTLDLNV